MANLNENIITSTERIVAFFPRTEDAYRAIEKLKEAGFSSEQIGLISRAQNEESGSDLRAGSRDKSFWDKVKEFFGADSPEDFDYRDSAAGLNWESSRADFYYRGIHEGGALVSVSGPRVESARAVLQSAGGDLRESGFESVPAGATDLEGEQRIQLRGEVLRTFKERVRRGEVRIRKEVVTENQRVEVPVTREELVVESVPVSERQASPGEIGAGEEIRVPLSEEVPRVEKQQVVQEEVRVGKRAVQKTEHVSDDVRHEQLRVDKEGDVEVDTRKQRKGKMPAA
jgi:uncharacterized protein (TIGR02271 family)